MIRLALSFIGIFLVAGAVAHAQTTKLVGALLNNAVITPKGICDDAAIGDNCGGGKYAGIFSGYRYAVTPGGCTNSSTPVCDGTADGLQPKWANNSGTTAFGVNTGATSTTDGQGNTSLTAAFYTDTDAAKFCSNMNYGGYTDWFFPAKDELNFLYPNRAVLGGFRAAVYISSTEFNAGGVWGQNFSTGAQSSAIGKDNNSFVRCVRKI